MEKVQRGSIILPALRVFAVPKGCDDRYGHVVMMSMSCVFNQHTLETALLSASQEIEMGSDNPAAMQSVIQQRDLLESGLLSTCREISRVTAVSPNTPHTHTQALDSSGLYPALTETSSSPNQELERLWREYDKIEGEVTVTKNILLEQLEALGSPQVLWRKGLAVVMMA